MKTKVVCCLTLCAFALSPALAEKKVRDFKARQCGGNEALFQLSEHTGAWLLLDFLLSNEDDAEKSHYSEFEAKSDQLIYQENLLPVFFKPNESEATKAWWESIPGHSVPVFRDPDSKLASALGIPKGLGLESGLSHYPATILVDPDGNEVWRHVGKKVEDRAALDTVLAELKEAKIKYLMKDEGKRDPWDPNDPNAIETGSGLKYVDLVEGRGHPIKAGRVVRVHYTGWLTDGTKFDSSRDRGTPIEFRLGSGQMIDGWNEGIQLMKVGGIRKLIIPPELGYKDQAKGKIPPNSTLVFEVELVEVK